jgi:hypothetical protein
LNTERIRRFFYSNPAASAAMSGLPDVLKISDGAERLSLPPNNLPVSSLIEFQLPPQRKSTVFAFQTVRAVRARNFDFLSHFAPVL